MHKGKTVAAVIPAAGESVRFGGTTRKQFAELSGKPVWIHAAEAFQRCSVVDWIVVVGPRDAVETMRRHVAGSGLHKVSGVIEGGRQRQDSVYLGLKELWALDPAIILVHDAVRPLVSPELILNVIESACVYGAAVPAVRPKETIKVSDGDSFVAGTLLRDTLRVVQTPQGFEASLLYEAFQQALRDNVYATDEAALVERIGKKVRLIEGDYRNVKMTTPEDLRIMELMVAER